MSDAVRIVCEETPRLSALRHRQLSGEIRTIIGKTLRKEPEARYASVAALRDDIQRYLHHQPILAHPPSALYQLRKLLYRRKLPSALLALLAAVVVGFAAWMSVLYRRADSLHHTAEKERREAVAARDAERDARERAEQSVKQGNEVQAFFSSILLDGSPRRGRDVTLREVLDEATERIDGKLGDFPYARSWVLMVLGRSYVALGEPVKAEKTMRQALSLRKEHAKAPQRVAHCMYQLGCVLDDLGRLDEAGQLLEEALEKWRSALGDEHVWVVHASNALGYVRIRQERDLEAELLFREAIALRPRHAAANTNLAYVLLRRGECLEAAEHLDMAEPASRKDGKSHWRARRLSLRAILAAKRGDFAEAQRIEGNALALMVRTHGADHAWTAAHLN